MPQTLKEQLSRQQQIDALERDWANNPRWKLVKRGYSAADVVRLRTYVVGHSPDKLQPVIEEIMAFYDGAVPAANTWIGVQSLAMPEFLIATCLVALFAVQLRWLPASW